MKTIFCILFFISIFFINCSNDTKNYHEKDNAKSSVAKNEINKYENMMDTVLNRERYLFIFNNESGKVSLIINSKIIEVGRYNSSLISRPEIEIYPLNKNNLGIIIMTHIEQFGKSIDGLHLLTYNINNKKIKSLCDFSDIALHNIDTDTLDNIIYFDYIIDDKNNKIVVKEYLPYKNLENIKQKYKIKSRKCIYTLK